MALSLMLVRGRRARALRPTSSDRFAQWLEGRANLLCKELRLFPRREVPAFVGLVEVDQLVIGPLRPAPRRLKTLAWEDGDGRRDGDVGREIKVDLVLPIEPAGENPVLVSQ
jgi:hypothetical protein